MKHDTKAMVEIWPQLVYKPVDHKGHFYWARADVTRSLAMFGCDQQPKDNIKHSFEAVYGWKGLAGIMGHPVSLRTGLEYDLSDSTGMKMSANWANTWQAGLEVTH